MRLAAKLAHDLKAVPGIVDSHVFQVPDAPALGVDHRPDTGHRIRPGSAKHRQQRAGHDQFQRPDDAEFLGRSAQRRQLSAGRADADLSHQFDAGFMDDAGDRRKQRRSRASF